MKRIEHESYGIFFLKYTDAYQEFDSFQLNERQKKELFASISQIRTEITAEDYYKTMFKVLQKFPKLGERTFGEKYDLISKAVFV